MNKAEVGKEVQVYSKDVAVEYGKLLFLSSYGHYQNSITIRINLACFLNLVRLRHYSRQLCDFFAMRNATCTGII